VISDGAVRLELRGYRITRTVSADRPTPLRFTARKRGSFALIVIPSHIGVAEIRVGGPSGL
jgi:hypothetical protein